MSITMAEIAGAPYWLMKFGKLEHIQSLQQGKLFMNKLQYFIDLERKEGVGVGDGSEDSIEILAEKLELRQCESDEQMACLDKAIVHIGGPFNNCPVFCMFSLDNRNAEVEDKTDSSLTVKYSFTEEQIKKMSGFGDYVLIIKDCAEFLRRIERALLDKEIDHVKKWVNYFDEDICEADRLIDCGNNAYNIAFWKRQSLFKYQQEYRILFLNMYVESSISIDIGSIEDISEIVPTSKVLGCYLKVKYKTRPKM